MSAFDLGRMHRSGLLRAALIQAKSRADREQRPMLVWLTRKPAVGEGEGIAVCARDEAPPPESDLFREVAPSTQEQTQ